MVVSIFQMSNPRPNKVKGCVGKKGQPAFGLFS